MKLTERTLLKNYYYLQNPGGFQLSALKWGDLEPSYACVNSSRLSIASVDDKQHLSEVVFGALVGFSFKENDGFRIIPVHPGLVVRDYGVHEVGVAVCRVQHVLWVLGVQVRPGTRHFPYNENPTRALNTTSLKCYFPETDTIQKL